MARTAKHHCLSSKNSERNFTFHHRALLRSNSRSRRSGSGCLATTRRAAHCLAGHAEVLRGESQGKPCSSGHHRAGSEEVRLPSRQHVVVLRDGNTKGNRSCGNAVSAPVLTLKPCQSLAKLEFNPPSHRMVHCTSALNQSATCGRQDLQHETLTPRDNCAEDVVRARLTERTLRTKRLRPPLRPTPMFPPVPENHGTGKSRLCRARHW